MVNPLNPYFYTTLELIRQQLTPEQQQQLDELSPRQKRELVAVADERADGAKWAALNFCWLRLVLIKYVSGPVDLRSAGRRVCDRVREEVDGGPEAQR